jgi:hypothetical protein
MSDGAPTSGGASAPSTTAAAPAPAPAAAPAAPSASPTQALADAAGSAPANAAPAAADKRLPVVIDGVKREMTRRELADYLANEADEEDVVSTYRLRAAAQARMKAAAEERKRVEREIARIKDPEQMMSALIEHHGGDHAKIDAAIEKFYRDRLAREQMTPAEREALELRQENDRLRAEHQERQQREQAARREQLKRQASEEYRKSFGEAIVAAKLPNTKHTLARMAAHAQAMLDAGVKPDATRIAADVRAELRGEWEAMHGSLDDDGMLELLGEERMKRIRQRDVERLRAAQAAVVPAASASPRRPDGKFASKAETQAPRSMRDFFEKRRNG